MSQLSGPTNFIFFSLQLQVTRNNDGRKENLKKKTKKKDINEMEDTSFDSKEHEDQIEMKALKTLSHLQTAMMQLIIIVVVLFSF